MAKSLSGLWWFVSQVGLRLRYRIKVKGLDSLKLAEAGSAGVILLANHVAFIDPIILQSVLWRRFKFHAIAAEYLNLFPIIRYFLKEFGTLFIPNFDHSTNSYKKMRMEKVFCDLEVLLRKGESVLIYPGGMLKRQAQEVIAGNSGAHELISRVPDAQVVLVRTTGLWGSSFSKAITGKSPVLVPVFMQGFFIILKNLLFFTPRREVLIECELADATFPRTADRKTFNQYLENWFNKRGPEPLKLISYSRWGVKLPVVYQRPKEHAINLDLIPGDIKERIIQEIADIAHIPTSAVSPEKDLAYDLGLDSLDRSQLVLILKEQFGVQNVGTTDITTVGAVMAFAAHLKKGEEEEESKVKVSHWFQIKHRPEAIYPKEARSLLEAFLLTEQRMGHFIAATDPLVGEISYRRLKQGVIILARYIKTLPGDNVGVMLPSSLAANLLILACQLAGKVPVMINWTLGFRNLDEITQQTDLKVVISSWRFLDRLEHVSFGSIDYLIQNLEEIRMKFGLKEYFLSKFLSLRSPSFIMNYFATHPERESVAVLLFTSGTESKPKGVPLTHNNIMVNQYDALSSFQIEKEDVMLGFLPPFHSFGFSVTGILPLILGLRVAYFPNPTSGKQIVNQIHRWKVTFICSAPTFLKYLYRAASPEKLSSLRYVVSGAEAATEELRQKITELTPGAKFLEGYGITECGPILTLNRPNEQPFGVGRALDEVKLLVVDPEKFSPLHTGKEGLILAQGPNIFCGYLNPELKTPFVEIFGEKWYNTGDLGFLDSSGRLCLTGRLKRFVKIGGEMISLGAIEALLAKGTGKKKDEEGHAIAVIAKEQGTDKPELHLFTTSREGKEHFNKILTQEGMSNLIRLAAVHKISAIPTLGTGKIDYQKLAANLEKSHS